MNAPYNYQESQQLFADAKTVDDVLFESLMIIDTELNIQRTSLWMMNKENDSMDCLTMIDKDKGAIIEVAQLTAQDYPIYFCALNTGKEIVAHDAQNDVLTSEFSDDYLRPFNITSMLDTPIFSSKRLIGILCCEHCGPIRTWQENEQKFVRFHAEAIGKIIKRTA